LGNYLGDYFAVVSATKGGIQVNQVYPFCTGSNPILRGAERMTKIFFGAGLALGKPNSLPSCDVNRG
jgi:hypothetical protein